MKTSYIIWAKRSPFGNFAGSLSKIRVDDLLAQVLRGVKSLSFSPTEIDDVLIGCANQAGEDNRNLARMSSLLAGFPQSVPGSTINRLCGSSLDAIMLAHGKIVAGLSDCIVAGGAESMSRAPYVLSKAETSLDRSQKMFDTTLGWRFPNPEMEKLFPLLTMGETAEEVQKLSGISRLEQDSFALSSHHKAIQAEAYIKEEILPITIKTKKTDLIIDKDEGQRIDSSLDKLSQLKPAFKKDGTVTAGNSSTLNDGACVVVICSEEFLKRHKLKPMARIIDGAVAGLNPSIMGLGPVESTKKLCARQKMKPHEFDVFEFNEAFAVQVLSCLRELEIDPMHVNLWGGAIALGHPLGASGARLVTTMVHQMKENPRLKKGLASMCIGVGQGISLALENCH
jgi:acetyl-CoA acetyltransferase family protein